jgi:hypothetical protein
MAKTRPDLAKYKKQQDTPYVAHARNLMETGYKGLEENVPRLNTMDDKTISDINSRVGAISNRALGDFDINYRNTIGKMLDQDYGRYGTTQGTPSLYRNDLMQRQEQRKLADLAYDSALNYEQNVDRELKRRYNTLDMFSKLYSKGDLPQRYDDQNYELSKVNQDRAYQNDLAHWETEQNTKGTATNMGIDALALAGSIAFPALAPVIMASASAMKPSITGLVAPNASRPVGGISGKQAGGFANILSGKPVVPDNDGDFIKRILQSTGGNGVVANTTGTLPMEDNDLMKLLMQLFGQGGL